MSKKISTEFLKKIAKYNPKFQEKLANYSTWQIGGPAEILVISQNSQELEELVALCLDFGVNYTILGHASNVLISDQGIQGLVIINQSKQIVFSESPKDQKEESQEKFKLTSQKNTQIEPRYTETGDKNFYSFADLDYQEEVLAKSRGQKLEKIEVSFDSGVSLSYAIAKTLNQELTGLQWFAGIPGTLGGALYNNIHGGTKHLSDYFLSAQVLIPTRLEHVKTEEREQLVKILDKLLNSLSSL